MARRFLHQEEQDIIALALLALYRHAPNARTQADAERLAIEIANSPTVIIDDKRPQ